MMTGAMRNASQPDSDDSRNPVSAVRAPASRKTREPPRQATPVGDDAVVASLTSMPLTDPSR
jgi:L-asparaginase/Glu-tRNA(Gln) amidotransferase subunit D